jgi:hypothetical protein
VTEAVSRARACGSEHHAATDDVDEAFHTVTGCTAASVGWLVERSERVGDLGIVGA